MVKAEPLYKDGINLLFKCYYENNEIHNLKKQYKVLEKTVKKDYGMHLSEDVVKYYNLLLSN